ISFDFYSNSGQILIYSDSILTRAVLSGFTIPHDNSLTHYSEFSYESASGLAPEYVFDQESGLAYILDHGEGGNRIYAVTLKDISLCDQWKNLSAVHPDFAAKTEETYNENVSLRSEEHTSELQSRFDLVCRLLLEKKKKQKTSSVYTTNEISII